MKIKLKKSDYFEERNPIKEGPKNSAVSELRKDIVTGDWVVIATGRAKRPEDFSSSDPEKKDNGVADCLFCDPIKSGQEKDVLIYKCSDGEWTLRIFPNKYPAVSAGAPKKMETGPYFSFTGNGFHEVVVTRDHFRSIAQFEVEEIAELFDAYQERYLEIMKNKDIKYISIFHNHGRTAGASIAHPHSQIIAVPVVSPYVQLELDGSSKYYKSHKDNVFEVMAEYESESKERIVYENDDFIAFCPFSSRAAFEMWVMPKKKNPYFERINSAQKLALAEVVRLSMASLYSGLNNPDFNFYIHTAPCDGKDYPYYSWHIEILPKTSTWAGFELQTGIEISTIQPEKAAEYLRRMIK